MKKRQLTNLGAGLIFGTISMANAQEQDNTVVFQEPDKQIANVQIAKETIDIPKAQTIILQRGDTNDLNTALIAAVSLVVGTALGAGINARSNSRNAKVVADSNTRIAELTSKSNSQIAEESAKNRNVQVFTRYERRVYENATTVLRITDPRNINNIVPNREKLIGARSELETLISLNHTDIVKGMNTLVDACLREKTNIEEIEYLYSIFIRKISALDYTLQKKIMNLSSGTDILIKEEENSI